MAAEVICSDMVGLKGEDTSIMSSTGNTVGKLSSTGLIDTHLEMHVSSYVHVTTDNNCSIYFINTENS